ncbi:MAG: hypothetical protein IPJ61_19570 [Tessaracoccus sp.]|uniref:hypothetical protein n=1 Tax=Tessaracoccus sp. TaxID=1971211 RepID=UPI001ECAC399|nr:hypothetical protein [Tessaracoccus sp.]
MLHDVAELVTAGLKPGARFFDPFVGSAAVSREIRRKQPCVDHVLGDANPWLAALLDTARTPDPVPIPSNYLDFDFWRGLTDDEAGQLDVITRAQRFAICLHTAWGHRWKTDSAGRFTQSTAPLQATFCEPAYLRRQLDHVFTVKWLRAADIVVTGDWRSTVATFEYGDLVYLDPPYPETLGYGTQTWTIADLLDVIDWLADARINAVVSNVADIERLLVRAGFQTRCLLSPTASRTRRQRREIIAWRYH